MSGPSASVAPQRFTRRYDMYLAVGALRGGRAGRLRRAGAVDLLREHHGAHVGEVVLDEAHRDLEDLDVLRGHALAEGARARRGARCAVAIARRCPVLCACFEGGGRRYAIHGLKVRAPNFQTAPNTDGIDVQGTDFHIRGVDVSNGDDSICIKSPAANILVENSTVAQGNGLVVGTAGSPTFVRNVTFRDAYMQLLADGAADEADPTERHQHLAQASASRGAREAQTTFGKSATSLP